MEYAAFLRGINVGGHHKVKMEKIVGAFENAELKNVRTYLQSGNVVFESASGKSGALTAAIEKELRKSAGFDIPVILRRIEELRKINESNPFGKYSSDPDVKRYVLFLSSVPESYPAIPFTSPNKDTEVIAVEREGVFIICRKINGRYGFPNSRLDKLFGGISTSRNWNTILKLLD